MFNCDKCNEIDHVLLDGYFVGDRLLEGVLFQVRKSIDNGYVVKVIDAHNPYFSRLNTKMWLDEMTNYANNTMDVATCPKCKNDVYID